MAASKFTPETRGALIERFAAGLNLRDAATAIEVNEGTLRGWITRGRREDEGPYHDFAAAVDEARAEARERPEPMTEEEHRVAVSEVARKGSVQALKLYWEMLCADREPDEGEGQEEPLAEFDEVAAKRAARAAA